MLALTAKSSSQKQPKSASNNIAVVVKMATPYFIKISISNVLSISQSCVQVAFYDVSFTIYETDIKLKHNCHNIWISVQNFD
jgi:hypothetical protein